MSDRTRQLLGRMTSSVTRAAQKAFPVFGSEIESSSPLDSSPYVFGMSEFAAFFEAGRRHKLIIDALNVEIRRAEFCGLQIDALLVGGSFLRGSDPSDIDCLAFYRLSEGQSADTALKQWSSEPRDSLVDMKFCPVDVEPILVIKRAIFFSNLFSVDKRTMQHLHGSLLVTI